LAPELQNIFHTDLNLSILLITIFSIAVANIFPKSLKALEETAFSIGLWMMYIFLAVVGAATNLQQILHIGLPVLAFYLTIMFFHFVFMLALARLFKLDVYEVIISSAANIMGPSVAAPMAASLGQKEDGNTGNSGRNSGLHHRNFYWSFHRTFSKLNPVQN
jgi:uncharacterized membrane protein